MNTATSSALIGFWITDTQALEFARSKGYPSSHFEAQDIDHFLRTLPNDHHYCLLDYGNGSWEIAPCGLSDEQLLAKAQQEGYQGVDLGRARQWFYDQRGLTAVFNRKTNTWYLEP